MSGYIHVIRLSAKTGTDSSSMVVYQVNYVLDGNNYAAAWSEPFLAEFLRTKVPLSEFETAGIIRQLRTTGHASIGDVHIPANEATAVGLEQVSDIT